MPAPRHSLPPHTVPPFHSSGQGRAQHLRSNEPQRILEAHGIRRCDAVPLSEAWGLYGFRAAGPPGGPSAAPAHQVSQSPASDSGVRQHALPRSPSPRGDGFGGMVQRGGSLRAVPPASAPPSHLRSAVLAAAHMPPQPHHAFRPEQQRRPNGPGSHVSTAASQRSGGSAFPPAAAPPVRSASMNEARTALLIRRKVAAARDGVDMDKQPSHAGSASSGSSYNSQTSWRSGGSAISLRPGQLLPTYAAPSLPGSRRSSLHSMHFGARPPGVNLMTAQQRYGDSPSPRGALGLLNMTEPPPSSSGRASPPAPSPVAVWRQSLPFAPHAGESTSPPQISAKERIARMHLSQLPLVGSHPSSQPPSTARHSSHHLPRMPHLHMPRSLQKLSARSHSTREPKTRSISGPIPMPDFNVNPFRRSFGEDARRRSVDSEASNDSPGRTARAREKAQRKTLSDALGPPSSDDEGPYAICKAVGEDARRNSKDSDASLAGNTPRPDAQSRAPNGFGFVSRWGEDVHASQQRQQAMRAQQPQQHSPFPSPGAQPPFSGITPPRGLPLYAPQGRMQAPPGWSAAGPGTMRNPFDQTAPAPMLWQQPGVPQQRPRRGSTVPAGLPQRPQHAVQPAMHSPRQGAASQQGSWPGGLAPRMPAGGRRGSVSPWQALPGAPPPNSGRRASVSRQQGNADGPARGRGATTPQQGRRGSVTPQGGQFAQQQASGRRGSVSQRQQQGGPLPRGPPPSAGQRRGSALPRYVPLPSTDRGQGSSLTATAVPFVPGSQIPRRNGAEGSAIPAPMGLAGMRVRTTSQASQQRIRRPSVAANFLPATPRPPSAGGRRPSYSGGGGAHPGIARRRSSSGAGRNAQEPGVGRRRNGSISYQPPPSAGGRRRGSSVNRNQTEAAMRNLPPSPALELAAYTLPPAKGRRRGSSVGQQAMPAHLQVPLQATAPARPAKSPQRQESPPLSTDSAPSSRSISRESERPRGPPRASSASSTIRFGPPGTTGTTEGSLTPTVRAASTSLPDDATEESDDEEEDLASQRGTALLRQQVRVADPSPSIVGGDEATSSVGEYNGIIEVGFDRSDRRKSYLSMISSGDSVDTACEEERMAPSPPPMAATRASLPAMVAPAARTSLPPLRRTPSAPRTASMALLKRRESSASTRSEDEAGRLWKHLEARLGVDLTTGAKKGGNESPSSSRASGSSKLAKRRSITRTRSPESPWTLVEAALGELKLSLGKTRLPSPVPPVPPLPERVLESQDPGLRYAASDDEPLEEASMRSSRSNSLTGDRLDSSLPPTPPDLSRASSVLRASLPAVAEGSSSRIPIFTRSTRPLSETRGVRTAALRTSKSSQLPTRSGMTHSASSPALPVAGGRQRMDSASSFASSLMTTSSSPSRSQRSLSDGLTESDTDVSDLGSESGRRRSQSSSHSRLPRLTPRTPRNGQPLLPAGSKHLGGLEAQSPVAMALTALRSSTIRRAERDQLDMFDFGRASESEYVGKPTPQMRQHAAARLEIQARRALS